MPPKPARGSSIGGQLGAGRPPKALQLKNYEKALKFLDDTVEEALQVIKDDLHHPDAYVRIRCAELILRKYIPDKKIKEISGKDGGPIELTNVNKHQLTMEILDSLDSMEIDEIKEQVKANKFYLSAKGDINAEYTIEAGEEGVESPGTPKNESDGTDSLIDTGTDNP